MTISFVFRKMNFDASRLRGENEFTNEFLSTRAVSRGAPHAAVSDVGASGGQKQRRLLSRLTAPYFTSHVATGQRPAPDANVPRGAARIRREDASLVGETAVGPQVNGGSGSTGVAAPGSVTGNEAPESAHSGGELRPCQDAADVPSTSLPAYAPPPAAAAADPTATTRKAR